MLSHIYIIKLFKNYLSYVTVKQCYFEFNYDLIWYLFAFCKLSYYVGNCRGLRHLVQALVKELCKFLDDHETLTTDHVVSATKLYQTLVIAYQAQVYTRCPSGSVLVTFKFCLCLILYREKVPLFSLCFQTCASSSSILSQSPSQITVVQTDGHPLPRASQILEVSHRCHYFEYRSPLILDLYITYFP